jgi:ribosomal protein S18 acetylase RimI-like enzyme
MGGIIMKYELQKLDEDTIDQLICLSKKWKEEDCCYGMEVNTKSDLNEPLAVALDKGKIVGYIFGHFYSQEKKTSYIEIGEPCFSIDEFYVLPEHRCMGIGKKLFQLIENEVKSQCKYITLSTSTKNYKAILKLYIEELGMNFHSAFLIKQINI